MAASIGVSKGNFAALGIRTKTPFEKARNIGYRFEKEIDSSLWYYRSHGTRFFHFKLPDTHAWDEFQNYMKWVIRSALKDSLPMMTVENKVHEASKNKFISPKVPGDFILCKDGRTVFIECKYFSKPYFDFNGPRITDHQDAYAIDIETEGKGQYYFFLSCGDNDTLYIFTLKDRLEAAVHQEKMGYGSLKPEEFVDFCSLWIPRHPTGEAVWPIAPFLDMINRGDAK